MARFYLSSLVHMQPTYPCVVIDMVLPLIQLWALGPGWDEHVYLLPFLGSYPISGIVPTT